MTIFGGAKPTDARHSGEQKGQSLWSLRGIFDLLKQTYQKWSEDKAPRLGAALAYYTVFSLAPLLVVVIAVAGLVFGQKAAEGQIVGQLGGLVGEQSAQAIQTMIASAWKPTSGIVATIIGTATLLLGASGVFGQLQDALNTVWGVKPKPNLGLWGMLRQRFASLTTLLGTAFLLMVSLALSATLAALGAAFHGWLPVPEVVLQVLNFIISFGVISLLFAMMFKLLPDVKSGWSDVWLGGVVTALLFTVGQYALGLYLGKSEVGSSFGAAGSLVILLVWIYYSGQILLFGAEFTAVYANTSGSRIVPSEIAEPVSDQSPAAQQATRPAASGQQPAARPSPSAGQPTAQSGGATARASQPSDRQASEPAQGPPVAHLPPVTLTGHPVGHAAVSEVKGAAHELTQQVREAKDQIGGRLRRLLTEPMRVAQERESRRLPS